MSSGKWYISKARISIDRILELKRKRINKFWSWKIYFLYWKIHLRGLTADLIKQKKESIDFYNIQLKFWRGKTNKKKSKENLRIYGTPLRMSLPTL